MPIRTSFAPWIKYSPFVAVIDGRRRYFKTEALRAATLEAIENKEPSARLTSREYAEWEWCRKQLPPGTNMRHVTEYFLAHANYDRTRTIAKTVDEYIEARGQERLRPRYLYRLGQQAKKLSANAGSSHLFTVSPNWVEAYCRSLGSLHVQHNARTFLSILFSWCVRKGYMPDNPAAASRVKLGRIPNKAVEFLTLDQARAVLAAAKVDTDLLAPIALQLFAGVRSEEVSRLQWPSITMGSTIDVPAAVAKTGERRVIDWWPDNLTALLEPVARKIGSIAPRNYHVRRTLMLKKADLLGLPHNGFRHSYATYGVAFHQSASLISLQLGHHDSNLIFRHYRGYASQPDARIYFSLL